MSVGFAIIATLTIAAAVAAMSLRNLVHCALSLVVAFGGLAMAYLQLDAQFVGFAQVLVYVGAVTILIVFAILLTRGAEGPQPALMSGGWMWGVAVTTGVLAVLIWAINRSEIMAYPARPESQATVKQIGDALMTKFVLPLEVIGLLLTAALIGAVIIAMKEEKPEGGSEKPEVSAAGKPASSIGNRQSAIDNHP
jgi:NADH-quinone oxidoreductase subunit J